MADPYIAQIIPFGGNFAIRAWAFCEGQLLPISQNTALFSLLGTTYGGDGRTSFGLPDLRGRMMIGPGNGPGLPSYSWGQKGGNYQHTLTTAQMPSHTHAATMHAEVGASGATNPNGRMLANAAIYADVNGTNNDRTLAPQSIVVPNTGGGQSYNTMPPYLAVYYEIALQGIFPSRN